MGRHRSRAWGKNERNGKSRGRITRVLPTRRLRLEALEARRLLAFGWALQLDGFDDYATAADSTALDLGVGATDDFTLEASFYVSDLNDDGLKAIVYKDGAYALFADFHAAEPDQLVLQYWKPSTPASAVKAVTMYAAPSDLAVGWHHAAVVFDNEWTANQDLAAVFLDGARVGLDTDIELTPGVVNSSSAVQIGFCTGVTPLRGWIDEVRLSDVVRYSDAYSVPASPFVPDANTRALWQFDETPGATSFADASGKGNTLTGVNGARTSIIPDASVPDLLAVSDSDVSNIDNLTNLDNSAPDQALQFAVGNTTAGSTVTLYADGTAIGSAVAAGATTTITTNGNFDLADGAHGIASRQTLPGEAESADSAALEVVIDTTPPAPPPAPDLQAASDTGLSSTDNITADNTLTFSIFVSPAPYFRVYRDGAPISGDYEASGPSIGYYTTAPQADGRCQYTVAAVDAAGNASLPSAALAVTVDSTIPSMPDLLAVSDSGISHSDRITNLDNSQPDKVLQFRVGNTSPGATVTVYADGIAIGSAVAAGATTTVTTNGSLDLADGTYAITARQTLPGRAETVDSAAISVTIDTAASSLLSPVRLGGYDTSGSAWDVFVAGTVAYVADGPSGLAILDVSNPNAPVWLGGYSGTARGVVVSGTLAYVADAGAGLQVLDVSNPAAPVKLNGSNTSRPAFGVAVSGTLAYVAAQGAGLEIIDVSNPAQARRMGGCATAGAAYDVAVSGNVAYLATGDAGLEIFDVTNPTTPMYLGRYDTSGAAYGVAIAGNVAYVADYTGYLAIIDVSDPAAPAYVGESYTNGAARGVTISGTLGYVAVESGGLAILDLSNPAAPVRLGTYDTSGKAYGVAVAGNVAYVADYAAGLQIISINPAAPPALDLQSDTGSSNTDDLTGDNTPTFTLPVVPGAYFRVFRDGVQISGDWETGTTYTAAVQPDGTFAYALAVADAAGNVSPLSPPLSVTIDSAISWIPDLLAVSDTGSSSTDSTTNLDNSTPDKTLQFAVGNSIPGATVTLYADGLAIGTAVANGTTTTVTTDGSLDLEDGAHSFSATQTFPGREESPHSASLSVTVDTVPPAPPAAPDLQAASDTGISNTDNLTADRTPTFTMSAPSGCYYRVYRDGVQISGDYEGGTSYTTSSQNSGTHAYTGVSVDKAGNVSATSPALSVTIDISIPLAPDLLAVSDTGLSSTDNLTNLDNSGPDKTLQFTVGNTYVWATVTIYADGIAIGSAVADGATTTVMTNGSFELADGPHTITARQTLTGRAESTDSAALSLTIGTVAPITPPATDLQSASDTGISNSDNITADNTPTFDVTVPAGFYFRIYRSGVQISGDYESGASFTTPVQADGTYSYAAAVVDAAGNMSSLSPALAVTIDTQLPTVKNLLVGGTSWSSDCSIPVGSGAQLAPLPWANIDEIKVVFSENVSIDKADLTLSGVSTPSYDLAGATFSYDPATCTATWRLASPLAADKLEARLNADAAGAIQDAMGNRLDGEWANPASPADAGTDIYPSGNGTAGGDFVFRFRVLPADANQDGAVDIFDVAKLQVNFGQDHGMTPADGDFDGNGTVDVFDVALLQAAFGSVLERPAPSPAAPPLIEPLAAEDPAGAPVELLEASQSATFGMALRLDGVNDYATAADSSSLDLGINATDDFTIEARFYLADLADEGPQTLIHKEGAYSLWIDFHAAQPDQLVLQFGQGGVSGGAATLRAVPSDLAAGWHHVAAVFDNEWTSDWDRRAIFLDGVPVAMAGDADWAPGIANSAAPLEIGTRSGLRSFHGWIDEVRLSDVVRYTGAYSVPASPFAP
ncbi:MAG: Ig-like domain-containing protein, partial [Pirellulales bacterium]